MSIENIKDRLAGKKPEILPRYQSKGFGVKFYELKEVAEANPENRSAKALGASMKKKNTGSRRILSFIRIERSLRPPWKALRSMLLRPRMMKEPGQ